MTRVAPFSWDYTQQLGTGGTWLTASTGSNTEFGGDVLGEPGALSVVGLRSSVSLSSNLSGLVGDTLTIIATSPLTAQFATPSNTGASFGSNATRVSASSSVGASANSAREDHRHDGIGTVTASSSNTLDRGTLNLRAGANVSFALTDSDGSGGFDTLTIAASATGGAAGGSLTVQEPDATPTGTASTLVVPASMLYVSGSTATLYDDPVYGILGTPDTAYEFDTSSLAGLTAIGTPTTEDANTTVPGHLFYKDSTGSTAWMGRYLASPSTPFTAVVRVSDDTARANYNGAGLLVGVTNPATGAFVVCEHQRNSSSRVVVAEKFTNRTTFSSAIGSTTYEHATPPIWLAMVVNSTTSIDYYASLNGYVWVKFVSANNPSLTVGSVGLAMKSENANGFAVAFDYLRIWNSAKTLPNG